MLAVLIGSLALLAGLMLMLLPLLAPELTRARDGLWAAVVLLLALVLVTCADRLTGAPMLGVLCGGLLIGRLGTEVGQQRWAALAEEQRSRLMQRDHWQAQLQLLLEAGSKLIVAGLSLLSWLRERLRKPQITKRWVREQPAEAAAEPTAETTAAVSAEPAAEAEPTAEASAANQAAESQEQPKEQEPEPAASADPTEPAGSQKAEPEQAAEAADAEPEPEFEAVLEEETKAESEPETKTKPAAELDPAPAPEAEPTDALHVKPEPELKPDVEPDPKAGPEHLSNSTSDTITETDKTASDEELPLLEAEILDPTPQPAQASAEPKLTVISSLDEVDALLEDGRSG
ncbi:MAG: Ycf66 family protein [Synechococcus sp.]|nr:Ycf66 family protein [Synechococcus sp.]